MKKLATAFFVLLGFSVSAQTIFHYGNDSVSAEEFLRAWNKNNTGARTEKAFREYIDLYVNSRLKIKEATENGYDTLPQMIADLNNLRQQILPSYLNDQEGTGRLVNEAFTRSQKDIHIAHIFIPLQQGIDKANAALAEIRNGKEFSTVAKAYSADPSVQNNGGDIGWITVFSLPYELENIAYSTPVGKSSDVYASNAGYHIIKNLGERRAKGKMKASQILLAFPPGADEPTRQEIRKRADSIYNRLKSGDDFGMLATLFSNDVISAAANGQMQEFGIGQYDPQFENLVFNLQKDGEMTQPFLSAHGYHIVKRNSRKPAQSKLDEELKQDLQMRVEQSDRMAIVRKEFIQKQLRNVKISTPDFNPQNLWAYSDSILNYQSPGRALPINSSTVLMKVGDKDITVSDWISFAQSFRYKADGSGLKTYPQLYEEFTEALVMDYYQNHLEDFNPEFARQLQEFKEGNLFFEIMQKQVWGPAQTDTTALKNYFNQHQSRYHWKKSADAVIFYAGDPSSAKSFRDQLLKSPSAWNRLAEQFSENIAADSSRFELAQIPNPKNQELKAGTITPLLINKTDQ
ncbi:MAG TPA: peptidylprolyl isomerase, partial [Flavisolibacter sp.]